MTFKPQCNKDHEGFFDIPIWPNHAVSLKGEVISTYTGKLHPRTLHYERGVAWRCEAYTDEAARVNLDVPLAIHHAGSGTHTYRTVKALLFNALTGNSLNMITRPIVSQDGEKMSLLESAQAAITRHNDKIKPNRPMTRWRLNRALCLGSPSIDGVKYYDLVAIPLWLRENLVREWMKQQGV